MLDKLNTLERAAANIVSGAQLVMSANMYNAPMALLRQIVRQGTKDLRLVGVTGGGINLDFLVGAGAAQSVDTGSVTHGEFARGGPNFTRYVLETRVRALDNT